MAVDDSSSLGCLRFGVKDNLIFQFGFQHPKITVAQDATEILLRGQEGCRHPAQHHFTIPPPNYRRLASGSGGTLITQKRRVILWLA